MYTSQITLGSYPDWIGAVGSVLAFAGLVVTFWWETRKRRQDDKQAAEDRRDGLKRHARLVLLKTRPSSGSETQKRLTIHNSGAGPIIDIATTMWIQSNGGPGELREVRMDRLEPNVTELGPGEEGEVWLWLGAGELIRHDQEFFPQIEFTDCDGNRWLRRDNQQPVRVFT